MEITRIYNPIPFTSGYPLGPNGMYFKGGRPDGILKVPDEYEEEQAVLEDNSQKLNYLA